jgi:hypothetical protein
VVTVGVVLTVRIAAEEVVEPAEFVKTVRYRFPLSPVATVKVYVTDVAPEMLFQVVPPSLLTCHCTVGVGLPLAVAVKLTLLPAQAV